MIYLLTVCLLKFYIIRKFCVLTVSIAVNIIYGAIFGYEVENEN